jgi:hypothetical protein
MGQSVTDTQSHNSAHLELVFHGWERRFTAEVSRFNEMKEYYESLGFETLEMDGAIGEETECRSCLDAPGVEGRHKTLYTRRGNSDRNSRDNDMF